MYSVTIKDGTTERTFTAPTADEALRMAGLSPLGQTPIQSGPTWVPPDKRWREVQCGGAIAGGAVTPLSGGFAVAT